MRGWLLICVFAFCPLPAAFAQCVIIGDDTIDCEGTVYRAVDDECVHYVDSTAHQFTYPGIALPTLKKTIRDNYADDAVPEPVVVELTDYVDCTKTDHGFSDANVWSSASHPNKPSRLLTLAGKTFRVTAAPDDGWATYYYTYDVETMNVAGRAHLLIAELPNDQERYTSIAVHHPDGIAVNLNQPWSPPYASEPTYNPWGDPWWSVNFPYLEEGQVFGPGVGLTVYTGLDIPVDNQPYNVPMLFHPKTATTRIGISCMGVNTSYRTSNGGAVSQMWVFGMTEPIANHAPVEIVPEVPVGLQRRIGIYMTHPAYFYMHYGTPIRRLADRLECLKQMVRHMKYCGFNYIVFNAVNGADRTEKAWYPGSNHYDWNSAGDLLSELPPICDEQGVDLVPLITSIRRHDRDDGLTFTNDSYQWNTRHALTQAFNSPVPDPLRPEVQQLVYNLLHEIAQRCANNPSVRGIGLRVNGKIGTCYTSDQDGVTGAQRSGYSDWDLAQFRAETGSTVPNGAAYAYVWLKDRPVEWERWLNWRCARTRAFWLACRDLIQQYRSDLVFVVQCDLPSETPGMNIEWGNGETPYDLLRHHGYDPDMFVADEGIIITRGMMVGLDRFKNSRRWNAPWSTNWSNYKSFHFADGLAEMYRTAEGRSCEFYQDYWEENEHPFFEFGGPPNGFFRTMTPAAPGRAFFESAAMSMRRQDPDRMTWLGWNRPTLGHEAELRKFATAFRALPAVEPVAFAGQITPDIPNEIVARWHGDRLAVINDSFDARDLTLQFNAGLPIGEALVDVVTGRTLITKLQTQRDSFTFHAEGYSLNTFARMNGSSAPVVEITTDPLPELLPLNVTFHGATTSMGATLWRWDFGDGTTAYGQNTTHEYDDYGVYDVTLEVTTETGIYADGKSIALIQPDAPVPGIANPSFEDGGGSYNGWTIEHIAGEGPDNPPLDNNNALGPATTFGTHFAGKITAGMGMDFYLGQVVGVSDWQVRSQLAQWSLSAHVQLHSSQNGDANPTGVHQLWEIGWNEDGSEPIDVMSCDYYEVIADIDGTYTDNAMESFSLLEANGQILGVIGLRGVALRVRMYNDQAWWWTYSNIDQVDFVVTSVEPPVISFDFDQDYDIDSNDTSVFVDCMTGANIALSPGCQPADIDGDDDVDQTDFGYFQCCYSGPGILFDATCLE